MHVIKLELPSSGKLEEITILLAIKRTHAQDKEEEMRSEESEELTRKKKEKKQEVESIKKKTQRRRREITMNDFPMGKDLEPYNILEDLQVQKPNITWSQLLQVAPKVRCQWPKIVSTRIL